MKKGCPGVFDCKKQERLSFPGYGSIPGKDVELILYISVVLDFKRTDASAMVSYKSDYYLRNLTIVEICQTTPRGSEKGPGAVGDRNQPTPSSSKRPSQEPKLIQRIKQRHKSYSPCLDFSVLEL